MRSALVIISVLSFLTVQGLSQDLYVTKTGSISFYSNAPVEDITAVNQQAMSMLDTATGEIMIAVLIRSFVFEKAMMQEHFNENYMESEKFPQSTFKGVIANLHEIDLSVPGNYSITVTGTLTIKDQSDQIEAKGTLNVQDDRTIKADSRFSIQVRDYGIEIPRVVQQNIAETIEITCNMLYVPYEQ